MEHTTKMMQRSYSSCRGLLSRSPRRVVPTVARHIPAVATAHSQSRWNSSSSSSSSSSSASSAGPRSSSSNAPLAFAAGSVLSGGLCYYFLTQESARGGEKGPVEFNTQYGSPEDFKKAIEELRALLPGEDAVSTDVEDLEHHGFSENDYHPGECCERLKGARRERRMEREDGAEAHCAAVRAGSWPSVVVWPQSTEDVVKIMKTAVKYRMPVIPYSGATSLEGHFRAVSCTAAVSYHVSSAHSTCSLPRVGLVWTCPRWTRFLKLMVRVCTGTLLVCHQRSLPVGNSDVICQPGIRWMDLNDHLKGQGEYPHSSILHTD